MTNESKKTEGLNKKADKSSIEKEFARIKEGLKANSAKLADNIKHRVGAGDWKLTETDVSIDDGSDSIDLVFSAPDGKKEKYVIIDISIPHLGVGQKYALPGKAKSFQKEREVTAARIKKAIVLIRKGLESVSTQPSRIRCPIIEIQLESIVKPEPVQPKPRERVEQTERAAAPKNERPGPRGRTSDQNRGPERGHERGQDRDQDREQSQSLERAPERSQEAKKPAAVSGINGVSQELLFALKEAIVHECLSTMHKRCNKYIRKGLWRWIEREIMDPNVHFYLIILSSIYQGKTGEILSRRFKTPESYSSKPEEVISALFSKENNLADEIKKSSERHKKALNKFLACFSQQPPFEYLKSIFLKDFRSNGDGLKARMTVYTTLTQLLERCGFEGEKETQYPLEILDELKVFQGIMTGNYAVLRTDNASKKLKHLVPQLEWSNDDIYQLRNQLAKALNLPAQEFNLNAFLPQAFFHDAKYMAETRKEAIRAPITPTNRNQSSDADKPLPERAPLSPRDQRQRNDRNDRNERSERNERNPRGGDSQRPQLRSDNRDSGERENSQPQSGSQSAMPAAPRQQNNRRDNVQPRRNDPRQRPDNDMPAGDDYAARELPPQRAPRPINVEPMLDSQAPESEEAYMDRTYRRQPELDEAQHRFFEYFGGQTEEDVDAVKLALAMDKHKIEAGTQAADRARQVPMTELEQESMDVPPLKMAPGQQIVHMNPPRKPSYSANGSNGANGQPAGNRPDRKRRFSRNNTRNRPRRPTTGGGVNR